jgi:hypothetical protein
MHLALPHGEEGTTLELRQAVHAPRTDDGAVVDISARFFGHGFGVLVEGADVERGEVHTLHIPAEGASAEYTSASASSADEVDVTVATTVDGDGQVYVEARVAGTERFTLTLATDTGDPTLQARGPNAAADAELHIETTQGEVSRDLHVEVPLPPNGSARVVLARSTPGGTVTVELDDDGDGVVDDTVELADLPEGP